MVKLFTHNDLDGLSCALLAQLTYGKENLDFETCSYKDIEEKLTAYIEEQHYLSYECCYITDISFSESLAEKMNEIEASPGAKHFMLIDHHISALALNKYSWCHVTIENESKEQCSGTSLFYGYLLTQAAFSRLTCPIIKEYVEKVRRYDTWDWVAKEDLLAKQLNDLFYILGKERFMDYYYDYLQTPSKDFGFNETHKLLLELRQDEIDHYIEDRNEEILVKEVFGYQAGIVFANRFQSELGNQLALLHPELDFIAMINMGGGISCRTAKDNVNLALDIAGPLGGGGHAKAAGLPVKDELRQLVIDALFPSNATL